MPTSPEEKITMAVLKIWGKGGDGVNRQYDCFSGFDPKDCSDLIEDKDYARKQIQATLRRKS